MPLKSEKQRRWVEGCKHNRSKMRGKCPSKKNLAKIEGKHRKRKKGKK